MPERKADAEWQGDLKQGKGRMKVQSGAFEAPFSFGTRFQDERGTNPEELIGAAHAGCFSMAFAAGLAEAGYAPKTIRTTASVRIDKTGGGFEITRILLTTRAEVPGIEKDTFNRLAEETKAGCPVSKALSSVPIELDAQLAG